MHLPATAHPMIYPCFRWLNFRKILAVGTGIAQFGARDPDPYSSLTYTLATGEGDSGNAKVMLSEGGELFRSPLDYESASVLPVRIRVADEHGAYGEKAFSLSVVDVLEDLDGDGLQDAVMMI